MNTRVNRTSDIIIKYIIQLNLYLWVYTNEENQVKIDETIHW
jgi:hypothetical protein